MGNLLPHKRPSQAQTKEMKEDEELTNTIVHLDHLYSPIEVIPFETNEPLEEDAVGRRPCQGFIGSLPIEDSILPWKMNMMCAHPERNSLIVCCENKLYAFLVNRDMKVIAVSTPYELDNNGAEVNNLVCGQLGNRAVVASVDEGGEVRVVWLDFHAPEELVPSQTTKYTSSVLRLPVSDTDSGDGDGGSTGPISASPLAFSVHQPPLFSPTDNSCSTQSGVPCRGSPPLLCDEEEEEAEDSEEFGWGISPYVRFRKQLCGGDSATRCARPLPDGFVLSHEPPLAFTNPTHEATWGISLGGNERRLAVSANSWAISQWNLSTISTDTLAPTLRGHQHNIPCVAYAPNEHFLASSSIDQTVKVWNALTGQLLCSRKPSQEWCAHCPFFRALKISGSRNSQNTSLDPENPELFLARAFKFPEFSNILNEIIGNFQISVIMNEI